MLTNTEIVDEIAKAGLVRKIINKITDHGKTAKDPSSLDDLEQDIMVSLLTDDKVPSIYEQGHINYYVTRIVCNNIMSSSSPYYRNYLRPRQQNVELDERIKNRDGET